MLQPVGRSKRKTDVTYDERRRIVELRRHRSNIRSLCRTASLLGLLMSGTGCTIVGTALSPLTGTIDAVQLAIEDNSGWDATWKVPLMIVCSPFAGMLTGMSVDYDYLFEKHSPPAPDINRIMRPWKNLPGH